MALCKNCGQQIPDNAPYCHNCGAIAEFSNQNNHNQNNYKQDYQKNQGYGYNQGYQNNYNQGYPQNNQQRYPYSNGVENYNPPTKKPIGLSIFGMICSVFAFCVGLGAFYMMCSGEYYFSANYRFISLITLIFAIVGVVLGGCAKRRGIVSVMNGFATGMGVPSIIMSSINLFIAIILTSV